MKDLILVRHGKSNPIDTVVEDSFRELTDKGIKRTRKISGFLNEMRILPDLIVTSRAVRAVHTAKIIAGIVGYYEGAIQIEPVIYDNESSEDVIKFIKEISNIYNTVMIVGHNPELTDLVNDLYKGIPGDVLSSDVALRTELPTSGVVSITFSADKWSDILESEETTVNFIIDPKNIEDEEEKFLDLKKAKQKEKTFQIKKDTVKVKDLIQHLQTFDPELPVTYDTMEIGPVSASRSTLSLCVRIEELDYVDDQECEPFKSIMIG